MSRFARGAIALLAAHLAIIGFAGWNGWVSGIYLHGCNCVVYGWAGAWRVASAAVLALAIIWIFAGLAIWFDGGRR